MSLEVYVFIAGYVALGLCIAVILTRYMLDEEKFGHRWGDYYDEVGSPAMPALLIGFCWPLAIPVLVLALPVMAVEKMARRLQAHR
jgi:hypothetical protein